MSDHDRSHVRRPQRRRRRAPNHPTPPGRRVRRATRIPRALLVDGTHAALHRAFDDPAGNCATRCCDRCDCGDGCRCDCN